MSLLAMLRLVVDAPLNLPSRLFPASPVSSVGTSRGPFGDQPHKYIKVATPIAPSQTRNTKWHVPSCPTHRYNHTTSTAFNICDEQTASSGQHEVEPLLQVCRLYKDLHSRDERYYSHSISIGSEIQQKAWSHRRVGAGVLSH